MNLAQRFHVPDGVPVVPSAVCSTGLLHYFAVWRWFNGDDKRTLAIIVTGMLVVQGIYMVASYNNRQIIVHYPASRTTGHYVEAWKADDDVIVFTIPRPNTISETKFADFRAYAVCDAPDSRRFTIKVSRVAAFEARFDTYHLPSVPAHKRFCQPTTEMEN